jgi:hypothetical protein
VIPDLHTIYNAVDSLLGKLLYGFLVHREC